MTFDARTAEPGYPLSSAMPQFCIRCKTPMGFQSLWRHANGHTDGPYCQPCFDAVSLSPVPRPNPIIAPEPEAKPAVPEPRWVKMAASPEALESLGQAVHMGGQPARETYLSPRTCFRCGNPIIDPKARRCPPCQQRWEQITEESMSEPEPAQGESKTCRYCGKTKPFAEFWPSPISLGNEWACLDCTIDPRDEPKPESLWVNCPSCPTRTRLRSDLASRDETIECQRFAMDSLKQQLAEREETIAQLRLECDSLTMANDDLAAMTSEDSATIKRLEGELAEAVDAPWNAATDLYGRIVKEMPDAYLGDDCEMAVLPGRISAMARDIVALRNSMAVNLRIKQNLVDRIKSLTADLSAARERVTVLEGAAKPAVDGLNVAVLRAKATSPEDLAYWVEKRDRLKAALSGSVEDA